MKINWYPGHIAKAKNTIKENLKLVDIVLEVRDARIPESSKPEALEKTFMGKPKLLVLNKKDLASSNLTEKWLNYYRRQGFYVSNFSKDAKKDVEKLTRLIDKCYDEGRKGRKKEKAVKVMVVGIPNVGKSTVLNQLCGRKVARTGAAPGITRGKQLVKLKDKIHLLDTPGVLLPEYEDKETGYKLAACEAIDIDVFPLEEICEWLFNKLKYIVPDELADRYKFENITTFPDFLEEVGKKRGALIKGGSIDYEKACKIFIQDFNRGKLGRVCLEDLEEMGLMEG